MVQTATAPTAAPENPTAIFDTAIADAERLLELFDKLPQADRKDNEVLKRAALVSMAPNRFATLTNRCWWQLGLRLSFRNILKI